MAYTQLVRPGAPVIFGTFASSMSMATGAPTFGTPEGGQAISVMAALARRVGTPFRSGGQFTASKYPDAQAAYESSSTIIPTVLSGVNFVLHAAGWQEGGLALGFEKLILDADQLGFMDVYARGIDISENGQAMEAFRTNPHGEHFLGNGHTLQNFETAFARSTEADNNSFEQWTEEGSLTSAQRANTTWKRMLAEYTGPGLDEAIDAELQDFIGRRKASMPDANY
jgi:trimethylamine--corrinoid protein Co-methyltransferase